MPAYWTLIGIIVASGIGALVMCLLVLRYGFTPPADPAPDRAAGASPGVTGRLLATRLGHAVAGACFAVSAMLAVVALDAQGREEPAAAAVVADAQRERQELRDGMQSLDARVAQTESRVEEARARLDEVQARDGNLGKRVAEVERRLTAHDSRLAAAETTARQALNETRQAAERLRAAERARATQPRAAPAPRVSAEERERGPAGGDGGAGDAPAVRSWPSASPSTTGARGSAAFPRYAPGRAGDLEGGAHRVTPPPTRPRTAHVPGETSGFRPGADTAGGRPSGNRRDAAAGRSDGDREAGSSPVVSRDRPAGSDRATASFSGPHRREGSPPPPTARRPSSPPAGRPDDQPDLVTKLRGDWETIKRESRTAGEDIRGAWRRFRDFVERDLLERW